MQSMMFWEAVCPKGGDEVFVHKSLSFGFEIIFATDYVLYESLYFFCGFAL